MGGQVGTEQRVVDERVACSDRSEIAAARPVVDVFVVHHECSNHLGLVDARLECRGWVRPIPVGHLAHTTIDERR